MEKLVRVGILFDFYGKLLSERQFMAIELYYIHDLSLTEIGEELDISRQSVFDTLKRAEENLYEFEQRLKLVKKFNHKNENMHKLYWLIDDILKECKKTNNQTIIHKVQKLKKTIKIMVDSSQEVVD